MTTSRIATRFLINTAALWVAARVVPGVEATAEWLPFLGVAMVFGVVNTCIGTLMTVLTLPLVVVTIGAFLLVINGWMLWLTSAISGVMGLGFHVRGFGAAFWGALVVSLVSAALAAVIDQPRVVSLRRS